MSRVWSGGGESDASGSGRWSLSCTGHSPLGATTEGDHRSQSFVIVTALAQAILAMHSGALHSARHCPLYSLGPFESTLAQSLVTWHLLCSITLANLKLLQQSRLILILLSYLSPYSACDASILPWRTMLLTVVSWMRLDCYWTRIIAVTSASQRWPPRAWLMVNPPPQPGCISTRAALNRLLAKKLAKQRLSMTMMLQALQMVLLTKHSIIIYKEITTSARCLAHAIRSDSLEATRKPRLDGSLWFTKPVRHQMLPNLILATATVTVIVWNQLGSKSISVSRMYWLLNRHRSPSH